MFLSHEEVCELTGAKTRAGQIENLRMNGVRHTVKRNGWPAVARESVTAPRVENQQKPVWSPSKAC